MSSRLSNRYTAATRSLPIERASKTDLVVYVWWFTKAILYIYPLILPPYCLMLMTEIITESRVLLLVTKKEEEMSRKGFYLFTADSAHRAERSYQYS